MSKIDEAKGPSLLKEVPSRNTEERLKEIIALAVKLKWILPKMNFTTYPLMQLSEVEKCMLAMVDDFELVRMRKWAEE